jgi:hypothetical protein
MYWLIVNAILYFMMTLLQTISIQKKKDERIRKLETYRFAAFLSAAMLIISIINLFASVTS